jgi:hypothetical protein
MCKGVQPTEPWNSIPSTSRRRKRFKELKNSTKRGGGVGQVTEHLPSKDETLSSNCSIAKQKKKRKRNF